MLRPLCLCVVLLLPAAASAQGYRPLSLADIVKAVGTNPEGLPTDEWRKRVSTYTYHTSDDLGVGVSVRFAEDPEGAILVGWRSGGQLWRYAWIEESSLGRLEALRPAGPGFIIDTRHPDGTATTAVLRQDLTLLATVPGIVRLALTSGALVVQRERDLALFDPVSAQTVALFAPAGGATPLFSTFMHDARTDALTFQVRSGGTVTAVRCTAVTSTQRKCA